MRGLIPKFKMNSYPTVTPLSSYPCAFLIKKISSMKKTIAVALVTFLFFACSSPKTEDKTASPSDSAAVVADKPKPAEFADAKYAEIGRSGLANLTSGNIDAWMSSFADNAVYVWNGGDSLAGKAAISAYWKKRRTEVIDSISFMNQIWLPIKVNQPQSVEQPGTWVLGWYMVSTKYKNGKRMGQWVHTDMHFDANDKIDRLIQYLDRSLINAALKK